MPITAGQKERLDAERNAVAGAEPKRATRNLVACLGIALFLVLAAPRAGGAEEPAATRVESKSDLKEQAKSSRRSAVVDPATATELPIERLHEHWMSHDAQPQAPGVHRSTLAEVMRRMAFRGDRCPFCGSPGERTEHNGDAPCATPWSAGPRPAYAKMDLGQSAQAAEERATAEPLRSGEPAQVILETKKRLGKSVLEGTEFGGSPDLLIHWIRLLDEEHQRAAALDESLRAEPIATPDADQPVSARSQVDALREASRRLQDAADLLEDQNLFDSADSLRQLADEVRRQAREKVSEIGPASDNAASQTDGE
jgi:hypothetical protein